jgi:hypothetical protein
MREKREGAALIRQKLHPSIGSLLETELPSLVLSPTFIMRLLTLFSLSGLIIPGFAKAAASTGRPLEWLIAAKRNTGKAEDYCFDLRKRLCQCEHLLGLKYTVRYQISTGKVIFADVGRREAYAVCASSTTGGVVLRGGNACIFVLHCHDVRPQRGTDIR